MVPGAPHLRAYAARWNFVVAPQVWGPAEVCMWGARASRRAAAALPGPRWSSPKEASEEKGKREEGARAGRGDLPSWSSERFTATAGLRDKDRSAS